jgi:hypothetical protein
MLSDAYGNFVTTSRPETIAAIDSYTANWTGYRLGLRDVFSAAESNPDCAYLNACAASVHMALEARSGFVAAQPYLERMRRNSQGTTEREQSTIAAVDAWSRGDTKRTLGIYRDHVDLYPADIAAAKWGQYHAFNLGDAVTMRAIAQAIMPAHRLTAEAWGMLSFAEEQCHQLDAAEGAGSRAIDLRDDDVWAHHALAHVFESQDRGTHAIRFLTPKAPSWNDRGIFIREHNWWHLAMFHLDRGETRRVLEIYDRHLWGTWPEFAQEQIGAISALWRLELHGADVGARWQTVAGKIVERGCEHVLPFHDLHYIYALARAGRTAATETFLRSLARYALEAREDVWTMVAFPAAQAIVAHARGEHARAAMLFLPLIGQLHRLGGSHSQRDVMLMAWIHSALASSAYSSVEAVLMRRAKSRARLGSLNRFMRLAQRNSSRLLKAA